MTPDFRRLFARLAEKMRTPDKDWLDQLDWRDTAFAYGLLAFVAFGFFVAGRYSVIWF